MWTEYAAPTGLCPSPIGWERVAAGRVRVLFCGSTNMPRLTALGTVGRAILCPPPLANERVRVHHDGAHGVTRPTAPCVRVAVCQDPAKGSLGWTNGAKGV